MTKKVLSKKDRENKDFFIKIIVVIGIILFEGVLW